MVEVFDAAVKFERKNLHAGFEIHRQVVMEVDEFRVTIFVDCAIGAFVEPLEIETYAYTEPIPDEPVLPVDTSFVI